ncbi:hypothetical protein EJ110_NYTH24645 [Nymphaea thermarum]|nr:hypothetical protein EJ110_NYTH24645 [Nymphaea thermarum]
MLPHGPIYNGAKLRKERRGGGRGEGKSRDHRMGSTATMQDGSRWLSRSQRRIPTAAAAAADLMACFPTRAPLMRIMPKPVCSPSRPMDNPKRGRAPSNRPMFKTKVKTKGNNGSGNAGDMEEPTSPKVTCAGQIRIKPRARACKSWQTVMEEIERLHARKRGNRGWRTRWLEPLQIKKEIMHFLEALRGLRLDFRCFGAVPMVASSSSSSSSASEEEDDEENEENGDDEGDENEEYINSRAAFSQWSMMMQRSSSTNRLEVKEVQKEGRGKELEKNDDHNAEDSGAVPPKNALFLMRCRSAPAQGWRSRGCEEEQRNNKDRGGEGEEIVLARYAPDFYMLSSDIAKETWVRKSDFLHRSRTLKR